MKKIFSVLVILLSVASVSFAQKGVMKFKEETHNFGKIAQGKPVTTEFTFTNTGTQPIVISNVSASCGCTTPEYTKAPVLPKQTGTIKATYNAAAMGAFNKSITVFSNAESPSLTLFLKGEVVTKEAAAKPSTQK
ncbi:DUF1573 domain-containing protein [Arundinibacter roseus]|uniref:DUF1573 domain-containing protein n=1 Tax=Arundinibacter roseus TaxID=2070510 RepID=A0A4R4K7P1_9BACT|nr:DUF1573 domain-containing protein [Arundinibacter roseus]TDB63634.1 DUF1573 domain-containing protein [Arundinibacter roseus]